MHFTGTKQQSAVNNESTYVRKCWRRVVRRLIEPKRLFVVVHRISEKVGLASVLVCIFTALYSQSVLPNPFPQVSIDGKDFRKDGVTWVPKGVVVEGFNEPPVLRIHNPIAMIAQNNYNSNELQAIKRIFGGDTIHFKISQPGLDPLSQIHDPTYISEIALAVQLARKESFVVILSMDSQGENGIDNLPCMPNDSTARAWRSLAPTFAKDQGVLLELFNEPCKSSNAKNNEEWAIGTQMLIDAVRESGSINILLLNGLMYGRFTNGLFSLVHDSLTNRIALSIHPYLSNSFRSAQDWERSFGASSREFPAIATEWNATPTNGCVDESTDQLSLKLVRYLQELHVGLVGWAIDSPHGKIVVDHTTFRPTDYTAFKNCGDQSGSGGGKLIANYPHN